MRRPSFWITRIVSIPFRQRLHVGQPIHCGSHTRSAAWQDLVSDRTRPSHHNTVGRAAFNGSRLAASEAFV